MPIIKRRLDICGREKAWEYQIEAAGHQFYVTARQIGQGEPDFECSCGADSDDAFDTGLFPRDAFGPACSHIAEVERDLNLARQVAAQMIV